MLEMVLLVCNRNAELLRLVRVTFDSKVVSLRKMRKKNLIILKSENEIICGKACEMLTVLIRHQL